MEKKEKNISFGKAGNGVGSKINLPMPWLKKMGITQEDRAVIVEYDEENQVITIKKRE